MPTQNTTATAGDQMWAPTSDDGCTTVRQMSGGNGVTVSPDSGSVYVAAYDTGSVAEADQALTDLGEYVLDEAWYVPIANQPAAIVSQPDIAVEPYPTARYAYLWQYHPAND